MLNRHLSPGAVRRPAATLAAFLTACAGPFAAPPLASATSSVSATSFASPASSAGSGPLAGFGSLTGPGSFADAVASADAASTGDCGTLTSSGSAFGYLDNGTLSAEFCVGLRSVRRINVTYDKAKGAVTNIRLGYQRTNSSGVGIRPPVYAPALTATPGNTAFRSFSLALPQGCYHGVMLNTATRYQYVTKVWGDC